MKNDKIRTKRPERISKYFIPRKVITETQIYFRKVGEERRESIAYWSGVFKGSRAIIKGVVFPNQDVEAETSYLGYSHVGLQKAFEIGKIMHERKEYLLIQLHTHPFEAFHSWIDNSYPISHRVGFVSVVIPHFARNSMEDKVTWGVYEYKGEGKWRTLNQSQINIRFVITNGDE